MIKMRVRKEEYNVNIKIEVKGTSWPLPETTSGASLRAREKRRRFFPKSNKDFALNTSCTVLRRIGTVPFGHSVPFWCQFCIPIPISLFSFSFIPFGISLGTLCCIHAHSNIQKYNQNFLFQFQ